MIKKASIFGLLLGVCYILWLWIVVATGLSSKNDLEFIPFFVNLIIVALPMYIGLLHIRKNVYHNVINYGQSFYAGILISLTGSAFILLVLFIFEKAHFLIPQLVEELKSVATLNMTLEKKTPAEISAYMETLSDPYLVARGSFAQVLFKSVIVSTIVALFVRNANTFTETHK